MAAARVGKGGYVRQIAGYNASEDDTCARYVSWAIFGDFVGHRQKQEHRRRGAPHSSKDVRVPCVCVCVCVPITSDKTTFSSRREFAEKHLHACPLSASVFKLT